MAPQSEAKGGGEGGIPTPSWFYSFSCFFLLPLEVNAISPLGPRSTDRPTSRSNHHRPSHFHDVPGGKERKKSLFGDARRSPYVKEEGEGRKDLLV